MSENISLFKRFMTINKIEGYSFLILLFVAMPLKYMAGYPIATKIVGSIHGLLVLAFIYYLLENIGSKSLNRKEGFIYFLLSLVPFGSFWNDKELKKKL